MITNFTTRRILIDNWSSADILLKGFSGEMMQSMDPITLPVMIKSRMYMATMMMDFLVQRHNRKAHAKQSKGHNLYVPPENEISNGNRCK